MTAEALTQDSDYSDGESESDIYKKLSHTNGLKAIKMTMQHTEQPEATTADLLLL